MTEKEQIESLSNQLHEAELDSKIIREEFSKVRQELHLCKEQLTEARAAIVVMTDAVRAGMSAALLVQQLSIDTYREDCPAIETFEKALSTPNLGQPLVDELEGFKETLDIQRQEIAELKGELEQAKKDGERLDWLAGNTATFCLYYNKHSGNVRTAIDAAMNQQEKEK